VGSHPADPELTDWALALLAVDAGTDVRWPPSVWLDDAALAASLPAQVRTERAAALLARASVDDRARAYQFTSEVAACPAPWPPVLADAVIGVLARAAARPVLTSLPRALIGMASGALPAAGSPDYAAELTRLATAQPQDWAPLLHAAAETIALRRAFLAELR
jgi:hypothetical protein